MDKQTKKGNCVRVLMRTDVQVDYTRTNGRRQKISESLFISTRKNKVASMSDEVEEEE